MKKKLIECMVLVMFCLSFISFTSVFAADMLITNYSFETGTTGWTQSFGSGSISVTTERNYIGSYSLKINDTSSASSYGMESSKVSAIAGTVYIARAKTYISSGTAVIYIRFWNSSNSLISSASASLSSPAGQWNEISVKAAAPAGTVNISVLLYSGMSGVGTAYYDDIGLTSEFTTIGTQITNATVRDGDFGKDELNNDVVYTVTDGATGYNAKFCVIDVNSLQVKKTIDMSGVIGAWAVTVATDGKAYAGSYSNGHLYQYTPGSASITDLGQAVAGESYIWDLQPGWSGKVYGGTYPTAAVFKYEAGTGFTQFGPKPFEPGEQYVRSLAYDSTNHILYVGIGAHAHLKRYDCNSGQTDEILPTAYQNQDFVFDLNYTGGKVFAHMADDTVLVMNVTEDVNHVVTATVECEIPLVSSLGISPSHNGKVYYTSNKILYYYDIVSKTYAPVLDPSNNQVDVAITVKKMAILQLTDQTNYPGDSLVAIGTQNGQTKLLKYNFQTGNRRVDTLGLPESPTNIQTIKKGPDGKMYSSGYVLGGNGVYTPVRSDLNVQYKGLDQAENMTVIGGKLYIGTYPSAKLYEYDPALDWDINNGGNNPKFLFKVENEQDRPFGMTGGEGKLFVGTVPIYGKLGGAFAIYDTVAGGTPAIIRNLVQDQSIISLVYKDGKVYGGTSVAGGIGSTPTQTSAKLFIYDVATGTKVSEITPVAGEKSITALTVGPDGKIWGMDEGYLFIYNPATGSIEYCEQKFPGVDYPNGVWKDAFLEVGKDGNVYGVIKGTLFKVDASTKAVTNILSSGASLLTQDDHGYLYYINGTDLKRYAF